MSGTSSPSVPSFSSRHFFSMASEQQSRIQSYLEKNKIGPLFEVGIFSFCNFGGVTVLMAVCGAGGGTTKSPEAGMLKVLHVGLVPFRGQMQMFIQVKPRAFKADPPDLDLLHGSEFEVCLCWCCGC